MIFSIFKSIWFLLSHYVNANIHPSKAFNINFDEVTVPVLPTMKWVKFKLLRLLVNIFVMEISAQKHIWNRTYHNTTLFSVHRDTERREYYLSNTRKKKYNNEQTANNIKAKKTQQRAHTVFLFWNEQTNRKMNLICI